ncbi:unnamed protein product, partial [Iphiclides podalirius]
MRNQNWFNQSKVLRNLLLFPVFQKSRSSPIIVLCNVTVDLVLLSGITFRLKDVPGPIVPPLAGMGWQRSDVSPLIALTSLRHCSGRVPPVLPLTSDYVTVCV